MADQTALLKEIERLTLLNAEAEERERKAEEKAKEEARLRQEAEERERKAEEKAKEDSRLRQEAEERERKAEILRQEAEERERKAEKKAKEAEEREKAKSLILCGLPEMKMRPSGSESGASIPSEKDHPAAILDEQLPTTCLIDNIKDQLDWNDTFAIWNTLKEEERMLDYGDEDSIRTHVRLVLLDIATSLRGILGADFKLSFHSELSTFGDAGDLWVVRANGMAVGVVEVKKPGHRAMTHPNILGECYDYMQDVRGFDGLDHVFCILTSYHQWRIMWLPDSDGGAKFTKVPEKPDPAPKKKEMLDRLLRGKLPPWPGSKAKEVSLSALDVSPSKDLHAHRINQGSSKHPMQTTNTALSRVVCGGPVLPWNHADLVSTLASVLVKMAFSPATKIDKAIDLDRQYRLVKPDTWVWKTLDRNFTLQFATMPNAQFKNFLLLMPLGQGENGIAWLAASETGEACVIKFQAGSSNRPQTKPPGGSDAAVNEPPNHHFDQEAERWREIWGATKSRAVTLVGKSALVMPYVKTCEGGDLKHQTPETKELAKEAINRMLDRGYVHRDLRWDHVGLCRRGPSDKEEAVFIDLGNVDRLPRGDMGAKEAAKKEMLKALGL